MRKRIVVILLVALLFVDCKKNSPVEPPNPAEQGYISLFYSLALDVKSTTENQYPGGDSNEGGDLLLGDLHVQVLGSQNVSNANQFKTLYVTRTGKTLDQVVKIQATGSSIFPTKILYPELDHTQTEGSQSAIDDSLNCVINIKAFFPPITKDTVIRDPGSDSVKFKFLDGRVDVMTTQTHLAGGKYQEPMRGQGSAFQDKGAIALTFHHLLSKISFEIKTLTEPGKLAEARLAWGKIQSVELIDYHNEIILDLSTNVVHVQEQKDTIIVHSNKNGWELGATIDLGAQNSGCMYKGAMVPPGKKIIVLIRSTEIPNGVKVAFIRPSGLLKLGTHHRFRLVLTEKMGVVVEAAKLVNWVPESGDMEF